jgi:hypothetical protein
MLRVDEALQEMKRWGKEHLFQDVVAVPQKPMPRLQVQDRLRPASHKQPAYNCQQLSEPWGNVPSAGGYLPTGPASQVALSSGGVEQNLNFYSLE